MGISKQHEAGLWGWTGRALVLLLFACLTATTSGQDLRNPAFMSAAERGFTEIYNIDYPQARQTFTDLRSRFPQHPAPPLYLATVVWLEELFGRNELDLDNFIAPAYFTEQTDRKMPPANRKQFFDLIQTSQSLSQAILKKDPKNKDARYFLGGSYGVLGAFAITIDRSYQDAFGHGKKAYKIHSEIIEDDPNYYDAYMSVGLYEYVVDNLPWYIKWIAVIVGYRGSEERGFEYLTRAAQKGIYAADDAAVLQMVLFVRENRHADALRNAQTLHKKYPKNYILHLNQAQVLEKMGRGQQAAGEYREVVHKADTGTPNYSKIPMPGFRFNAANKLLALGDAKGALEQYQKLLAQPKLEERHRALAHLRAGQALDLLGQRNEAISQYQAVLKLKDIDDSHDRARQYMKQAYRRG